MLVSMKEILQNAQSGGYAVGAFNISNSKMMKCVLDTCAEERAPALMSALPIDVMGNDLYMMAAAAEAASQCYNIPVCLHLDHATTVEEIQRALDVGFRSVMLDASMRPFAENVEMTQEVVRYAHAVGATVEAELGHVGNALVGSAGAETNTEEDCTKGLTDPDTVREFVEQTGVDALAVAIGTAHGVYQKTPVLQLERLENIRAACGVPLVLHGGSGTPDEDVKKAIARGITKINVYSEVMAAHNRGLLETLQSTSNIALWGYHVYEQAYKQMRETIRHKIDVFGTRGAVR